MKFLDAIMKRAVEPEKKEETMAQAQVEVSFKDSAEFQAMISEMEAQETALTEAMCQIDELKKQLGQFAEAKAVAEQATKDAIAKAHNEKVEARMNQLTAEFGDEKATKFAKFANMMEDAEFAEVFGIQKELAVKEEKSFVEQGIEGQVKADKKPIHFNTFIKSQNKK
jgi:hypothetical protein